MFNLVKFLKKLYEKHKYHLPVKSTAPPVIVETFKPTIITAKVGGVVSNSAIALIHKGDHAVVVHRGEPIKVEPTPIFENYPYAIGPKIRTPIKAVNQDVSKFMKHGRQSKLYRHAVRAHVNPDEEDIP